MDIHVRFVQQAAWTKPLRDYLFARVGLSTAKRVLEVGCGTGALLAELPADLRAPLNVHGLDISTEMLTMAMRNTPSASLTQGDALLLPFLDSSFDLALCHFLLLWVSNPQTALREMERVVRPGGAVLVLAEPDYGARIDHPDELNSLGIWQSASLTAQGADPQMGRKLSALFHSIGLVEIETGVLGGQWRQAYSSEQDFEMEWNVLTHDLQQNAEFLAHSAHFKKLEMEARRNGARVLFVPTFYAIGYRPPVSGTPI